MSETVVVTIVKAINLEPKCSNGFSEPFAELTVGNSKIKTLNKKYKTRIINNTLNPVWNETFYPKLNAKDPIKIEIFSNKLVGKDSEGMCSIEWWKNQDLSTNGEATMEIDLKPSALAINRKVKGKVVVKLQLAYFAEPVNSIPELVKFCPDVPPCEKINEKMKCGFYVNASQDELEDLPGLTLVPGVAFLLENYVYLYGVSGNGPERYDFMYDIIKDVIQSNKRKDSIVIKFVGGNNLVIGDVNETASLVGFLRSKSGKNDDGLGVDGRPIAFIDDSKSCQITFKIWCEEKKEGRMMSTYTNVSFEEIKNKALAAFGMAGSTEEYRLYASPPAARVKYCNDLPYEPKDKVSKAIRSKAINFGDVLTLKRYNPEEKPYLRSRGRDVYEASSSRDIFVNVEYWKNSVEHEEAVRMRIVMGQQLSEIVNATCGEHGDNPEQARLYRVGFSSEPGTRRTLVELDQTATMDQVYMTEGDTLVVRLMPPFKTFQEKFGDIKDTKKTAYSVIAHCYYNPIHRVWKKVDEGCPLPAIAADMKLSESDTKAINEAAQQHALYGCDEILIELADRIANTAGNDYYKSSSFDDRDYYKKWLEEQRKEVLNLMETYVRESDDFCCEVEMKAVRGTDLLAADLNGLSDPYVILAYKTQRKSTRVINRTLNPVWNESLIFRATSFDPVIGITCYDHDLDNNDDLLGTAKFNLYDHLEILDGQPHEYVIELENKEKQGTLTFEVTCHYPYSSYFNFVRGFDFFKSMNVSGDKKPIDIPCVNYYNELFTATGEMMSTNIERPWYLREFSSRLCMSEGYCAVLKLQTLMGIATEYNELAYKTIVRSAQNLIRTAATANREERVAYTRTLESFLAKTKEFYIVWILLNSDITKTELLTQSFREIAMLVMEIAAYLHKPTEAVETLGEGFSRATKLFFRNMTKDKINWEDPKSAMTYKEIVRKVYSARINAAIVAGEAMLSAFPKAKKEGAAAAAAEDKKKKKEAEEDEKEEKDDRQRFKDALKAASSSSSSGSAVPDPEREANLLRSMYPVEERAKLRGKVFKAAIIGLSTSVIEDINNYCKVAQKVLKGDNPKLSNIVKTDAYDTLKALTKLRQNIIDRTKKGIESKVFFPILSIWMDTSKEQLDSWIEVAVKTDAIARRRTEDLDLLKTVSFVDVSDAIDQTLAQVEEMEVDDHNIWTNISDILLGAVRTYAEHEGKWGRGFATAYVDPKGAAKSNAFLNFCISLSNIENAQTLVSELIGTIEHNLDTLAAPKDTDTPEEAEKKKARIQSSHAVMEITVHDTLIECKKAFVNDTRVIANFYAKSVIENFTKNPKNVDGAFKFFIEQYDDVLNRLNHYSKRSVFNKIVPVFADAFLEAFLAEMRPEALLNRGIEKEDSGNLVKKSIHGIKSGVSKAASAIKDNNVFERELGKKMTENKKLLPSYESFFKDAMEYFEYGISKEAISKNPSYCGILQYLKIYDVSTEKLIDLHMKLTSSAQAKAEKVFSKEEFALYGYVDADSLFDILMFRDYCGDRWADAYTDELSGSDKSQKMRNSLGFDKSEFFIEDFLAFNAKYTLSTKHLVYDPTVSRKENTVIRLADITRLSVEGTIKKTLKVTLANGSFHDLNAPTSDDFMDIITEQARAVGNTTMQVPLKDVGLPFGVAGMEKDKKKKKK